MEWSQLKKRIEERFAPAVQGRVELRQTRYHKAHDQLGRAWITLDGEEIINMCEFKFEFEHWKEASRLREAGGSTDFRDPQQAPGYYRAWDQAVEILNGKSIFSRWDFHRSLLAYLNLSIDDIRSSPNTLIRAIGMLDARIGKRRLRKLDMTHEHDLVKRLYTFRCSAEEQRQ
jgi:hypothetical protein